LPDERPDPKQVLPERDGVTPFPSAKQDQLHTTLDPSTPQTSSPAYRLGYADPEFIMRDELRPARLQLEFLKPDLLQKDRGIVATIVIFGSARIPAPEHAEALLATAEAAIQAKPDDPELQQAARTARSLAGKTRYYDEARRLAQLISEYELGPEFEELEAEPPDACRLWHGPASVVVVTGGGPGIMEAANRGAHDLGVDNIGLNIVLPFEQVPNQYITPHLCFNFHYFAMRKMHFLMRAVGLVVFPGGFGTMDELFEVLTLIQTKKISQIPVLLFGREYWERIINFRAMVDEGVIAAHDLEIVSYVETAEEAWGELEPVVSRAAKAGRL